MNSNNLRIRDKNEWIIFWQKTVTDVRLAASRMMQPIIADV